MWIHEGFTQYTEIVFIECQFGYEQAMKYAYGLQRNVGNRSPIIGFYGVNKEGSGDMYPKGALLLNTLRHIVNRWKTDEKNFEMPVDIILDDQEIRIAATNTWKKLNQKVKAIKDIKVNTRKFYVKY